MVYGVQGFTDTEMTVKPGAYEGRPDAVNAPAIDSCGGLTSPGGGRDAKPARMAIRRLLLRLHLAELLLRLQHGASRSSTSSICSISFLLNTRTTAIFNGLAARCNLYKSRDLSMPVLPHRRMLEFGLSEKATLDSLELRSASTAVGGAAAQSSFISELTPAIANSLPAHNDTNSPSLRAEVLGARRDHLALELDPPRVLAHKTISLIAADGAMPELAQTLRRPVLLPAARAAAASQPALTVVVEWPGSDPGALHPHA